jgi:hypothetical protein
MLGNRKKAQDFIIKYIDEIAPGGQNKAIYVDLFKEMNDEQFDIFMQRLERDEIRLAVIAPNFNEVKLTMSNNLRVAKLLGHNFFQRIWIEGDGERQTYLSPIPYMVVQLPLRRQAQLQIKKTAIPESNSSVDDFTGQPTGKSKGSKISYPETQVMAAMGLDKCLIEMIKWRGGDTKGFQAMNTALMQSGEVSLDGISHLAGGVEATRTLKVFLTCMHLKNTLEA